MPSRRVFVAQFPDLASMAGRYTRLNAGSSSDTVLEHALEIDTELAVQALGFLQGWPARDEAAFLTRLQRDGSAARVLQREGQGTLVRYANRSPRVLSSPSYLLHEAGMQLSEPWMHVEAGLHSIRAEGTARGMQAAAESLAALWGGRGVACQVGTQEVGRLESRAWIEVPTALHEMARALPRRAITAPRLFA